MRICFLGDSSVNGTGDPEYLGWPGRVCIAACHRGHQLTSYNLGVRHDTTCDVAARWHEETLRRLPKGIDGRVIFSFGANDCVIEDGARRVPLQLSLATARIILTAAVAERPTLVVGPCPIPEAALNARIAELSERLDALCAEIEVPYLPVFGPLVADGCWGYEAAAADGAHPGAKGYAQLAALVDAWSAWRRWLP
jgi:acyl-CoA thioesterase I